MVKIVTVKIMDTAKDTRVATARPDMAAVTEVEATEPEMATIVTDPEMTTIVTEPEMTTLVTEPEMTTIVTEQEMTTVATEPEMTTKATETDIPILTKQDIRRIQINPMILDMDRDHRGMDQGPMVKKSAMVNTVTAVTPRVTINTKIPTLIMVIKTVIKSS